MRVRKPPTRKQPVMPEPSEVTAAVVSGVAVTYAMRLLEMPAYPAIVLGALVWASIFGSYRKRWMLPETPPAAGPEQPTNP